MLWLNRLRRRVRALLRKEELDREMDEEMRSHIEMEAAELVRTRGLSLQQARRQAVLTFGGMERYREEGRDARGVWMLEELLADLRFAIRRCWTQPGFTATAILTLALGIGASTAIFSVVYGVMLKPLPFAEPDRLVGVWHERHNHGPGTYLTYRDHQQVFEDIGAWRIDHVAVTGRGEPERVEALSVSAATLPLLGVQLSMGRFFSEADDRPGSPLRVILTHGYWQRAFGGAHDVLGKRLDIDSRPSEIIGVLPSSYRFLDTDPAILLPMQINPAQADNGSFDFQVLGRLKPGVTVSLANADIARMVPLLPDSYADVELRPDVHPLAEDEIGDVGRLLWILLGTVGIVLLIACTNVANLFLVRAESRQQELAVRAALGASRGRIARTLLSESLTLGLAGGVLGLLFAGGGISLLRRLAPASLPRVQEIGLDPVVLIFTLTVSLLTGLVFGLIPVLRLGTTNATAIKEGGRSGSAAPARQRTRNTMVVAEVAMALVLLILSGLMIRTFLTLRQVEPGFVRPEEVVTFRIDVPEALVADPDRMAETHRQIAERLRQVPGVASVGLASSIPMEGDINQNPMFVEHFDTPDGEPQSYPRFKSHAPGYVETMGNRVLAGRTITWADVREHRRVAVISDTLAREFWRHPSEAIGKRVRGWRPTWYEVIGVVGNERDDGLNQPVRPIVYWPLLNDIHEQRAMAYAVRSTRVDAPGFVRELQQAVWAVNPNLPLANVRTLDAIQADSMARTSFAMVMLAIAAAVALLLGVVGIYGVITYVATQRTREIGIRIALGAQTRDVRSMFLWQGLRLTATGIALGIGAALLLTRVMSALLFGVGPTDPMTYAAVSGVLAAVSLLATYLPARRASVVDPVTALRADA